MEERGNERSRGTTAWPIQDTRESDDYRAGSIAVRPLRVTGLAIRPPGSMIEGARMERFLLCLTVVIALGAPGLLAQELTSPSLAMRAAEHVSAGTGVRDARATSPFQQAQSERDSIRNGAIIGAIVGAASTFAFGMYLCQAIGEDEPCLRPVLVLAGVGAGAGALTGAGIDALFVRRPIARVTVRF